MTACAILPDYPVRVKYKRGTVIHAARGTRHDSNTFITACGIMPYFVWDSKKVSKSTKVTCKSCLRTFDGHKESSSLANYLFVVRESTSGLFFCRGHKTLHVEHLRDATTYKTAAKAQEAVMSWKYFDPRGNEISLKEYLELRDIYKKKLFKTVAKDDWPRVSTSDKIKREYMPTRKQVPNERYEVIKIKLSID